MQMRRRQFCLTVTAGMATAMIPGKSGEARLFPGVGTAFKWIGAGGVSLGLTVATLASVGVFVGVKSGLLPLAVTSGAVFLVGAYIAFCGLCCVGIGFIICNSAPTWCSTGGGAAGKARVDGGDAPTLAESGSAEHEAFISLPLQHVPECGAETREAASAVNGMIDAYNRLRVDILGGSGLDGGFGQLRQACERVHSELGRFETTPSELTEADVGTASLRLQTEGMPPFLADYLNGCGFSEAAIEGTRQRLLQTDLSPAIGMSASELLGEAVAAVPESAGDEPPEPPVPVPDPGIVPVPDSGAHR